ncbi:MliC family protein [Psychrobacter sp. FDAARGOS_221]|uniref:MliC family protein n=1 Tax=Psychrobacter sp. FDAARGOS_221 TaxID=1975705 RepID=UPI000BB58F5A|nr:MliC family protein [Psychrobacter sp. FDAARGOS_221]PNK61146.1 hypothetical protein A6J60_009880 [Psychrobacter sp. FDAARGOS_221]
MKFSTKFLILLPTIALITSCTSGGIGSSRVYDADSIPNTYEKRSPHSTQVMTPINYTCDNSGNVVVDYANSSVVRMKASFPDVELDNQPLTLYRQVSGSGALYVDELNPNATIGWHTKADYAVFSIQWEDGNQYTANCTL